MTQKIDYSSIELLVLDVDGVLTDGTIIVNADGTESKHFSVLDGHGIRMWKRAGKKVAFLSGRHSVPTQVRAEQLEIDYVYQNAHVKMPVLQELADKLGLAMSSIAYIGDDLSDLPPIMNVGFGVTTANAVEEVKKHAHYITKAKGGSGAVREVIELILKQSGKWASLMERYESSGTIEKNNTTESR